MQTYREFSTRASAWIATALHNLNAGRSQVKKWFILSSDGEVTAQIHESRRHLTRMLQLMTWFLIEKGTPAEVGGPCSFSQTATSVGGTMAYVGAISTCGVNSEMDCGEKTTNGRYIINICEFYWLRYFDTGDRVGTIVHESSHHFGTEDFGYCDAIDCLSMPSAEAQRNADTYTRFVHQLVTMPSLEYTTPTVCNTECGAGSYENWDFKLGSLRDDLCGQCEFKARLFGRCAEG